MCGFKFHIGVHNICTNGHYLGPCYVFHIFNTFYCYIFSFAKRYMILAPATMAAESDPKLSAAKCLEEIQLDPESYRIGHTKASL